MSGIVEPGAILIRNNLIFLIFFSTSVSLLTTTLALKYAHRIKMIDYGSERASHSRPTPTGGGIGIVCAVLSSAFLYNFTGAIRWLIFLALFLAVLGLVDDIRPLSAKLRLVSHFFLVGTFAWASGTFELLFDVASPVFQVLPLIIFVFTGVWWLNLFNFMDGIDGLATSQAICMLFGAAMLAWSVAPSNDPAIFAMFSVIGACAGFLLLNWPPARIFMGDIGSTFLALMVFGLAVVSVGSGWLALVQWLILASLFVVDSSTTLARRVLRGEAVMAAHRSHAYQILARKWGSHRTVTLGFCLVNLGIVVPAAWVAGAIPELALPIVTALYGALGLIAIRVGAGLPSA